MISCLNPRTPNLFSGSVEMNSLPLAFLIVRMRQPVCPLANFPEWRSISSTSDICCLRYTITLSKYSSIFEMEYLAPLTDGTSFSSQKSVYTNSSILVALNLDLYWGTAARLILKTTQKQHFSHNLQIRVGNHEPLLFGKSLGVRLHFNVKFLYATIEMTLQPKSILSPLSHCPQLSAKSLVKTKLQHGSHFTHDVSATPEECGYTFWVHSAHWNEWEFKIMYIKCNLEWRFIYMSCNGYDKPYMNQTTYTSSRFSTGFCLWTNYRKVFTDRDILKVMGQVFTWSTVHGEPWEG